MARRTDPNSQYRVSIHLNNGHRYASTQPFQIDPVTGRKTYRHVHWGTVDESNKFIPGRNYILAPLAEREKLIFPDTWDLSEIRMLSGTRERVRPALEAQDENRLYGDIWLLEKTAETTGIREDLTKIFQGSQGTVNRFMTLVCFLFSGKGSFDRLAAWQRISKTPCDRELPLSSVTKLLQSVTEDQCQSFMKLRDGRPGAEELCVVDTAGRPLWETFPWEIFPRETFRIRKGSLGTDRRRRLSDPEKEGRQLLLSVAQILGRHLEHIRRSMLSDEFDSVQNILDEMRPIRYIRHPNGSPFITPFTVRQAEICEALVFELPENCSPEPWREEIRALS